MKVAEIFQSRQGEGANCGREAVFLRFAGCNLNCPWCDTDWQNGFEISAKEIIREIEKFQLEKKFLVVTGGEPLLQEGLYPLLATLKRLEWEIAVETNGLLELSPELKSTVDYVAVSPKARFAEKYRPETMLREADEVRIVCDDALSVEFCKKINILIRAAHYFIAPCETDGKMNFETTARILGELGRPWLLSVQLHKLAGFR